MSILIEETFQTKGFRVCLPCTYDQLFCTEWVTLIPAYSMRNDKQSIRDG